MTRLATRLTTFAVALAAVAQVVVAPASCCLIRAELFDHEACCHTALAVETPSPSCCHGPAAKPEGMNDGHRSPAAPSGECLWCSASPELATNDRVALPDLAAAPTLASAAFAEPVDLSPADASPASDEPFHRTALAACAWLCVWQI